jgi:hypothetical protein
MKKFNWTSTIRANVFMLKCVGLWPERGETYQRDFYTFYAVFNAILIIGGHNLSQLVNILFVYSDLEALAATIFVMITNILATMKMYLFVRNMRVIKRLLLVLDSFHFQPKSLEQEKLIQPSLKIWKKSYTIYSSIVAVNVVLWSIAPLMNEGQRLPFVAWYPFSTESSPNYQIIYVYQVVCIWYITIANINLDSLTYALMMYICAQCDILCDNLSLLGGTETDFSTTLRECIVHHKKIVW